jgi:MoxR-like ATPase
MTQTNADPTDLQQVETLRKAYAAMKEEIRKVIVGQDHVVDELFMAMFCRGHCLLIGVPGLAKTLTISTLAKVLSLSFNRIQFTPDLMPADITGTEVIQEDRSSGKRDFKFLAGPIFANVILADEINRTPPKTQAALLEAMQEYQVTVGGRRHDLQRPFFVLATQNPIEQEGTYPLPEAQLDRFMFMIKVDYPTIDDEREILRRTTEDRTVDIRAILGAAEIQELQAIVRKVPIADHVLDYALRLTRATRLTTADAPAWVKEQLQWGAGPRASQNLVLGAKARALLSGRFYVSAEDVRAVAKPVLRHRLITSFGAEAEGITTDMVIDRLLEEIKPNTSAALEDGKLPKVIQQ